MPYMLLELNENVWDMKLIIYWLKNTERKLQNQIMCSIKYL